MTYRFRWLAGFSVGAVAVAACSSTSGPTGPGMGDAAVTTNDGSTGQPDASSGEDASSVTDAPAAPTCDAASLAPIPDAALPACFQCIAAMCPLDVTTCSTDCSCAPAFACLEAMGNNNSLCPAVMSALSNSNTALTNLEACEVGKCNDPCYGDGG